MGARNGDTHGAALALPDSDLRSLAALIDRARAPARRVRPALRALCAYHAIALPLAGLGLLPPLAAVSAAALVSLAALAWVRAS
jgi:cation transport ATPase